MARGNVEDLQQFVVPIERVDVEDQRAAGVAVVGDVPPAAGQPPDEPAIDGAEQDLAGFGPPSQAAGRVEQVLDLRAGEIGVEHQAGLVAKRGFQPSAFSRSQIGG